MIGDLVDRAFSAWTGRKMRAHLPYPPSRTALLLVDVQRGFYASDRAGWREIREVAESVGFAENLADLTAACRDRGATVIHCPLEVGAAEGASGAGDVPYLRRLRDEGILVEGGDDLEIPSALYAEEDLVLWRREVMNVFYGADLEQELERRDVTHLLVAGSVANASVDSTGRMGVELDYDVTFVADGIAAFEPSAYEASVETTFPRMGNRVLTADDVRAHLGE